MGNVYGRMQGLVCYGAVSCRIARVCVVCGTLFTPCVGNPGFGIHCHPLDSLNPGFIWQAPLVNPLDSFGFTYRDS